MVAIQAPADTANVAILQPVVDWLNANPLPAMVLGLAALGIAAYVGNTIAKRRILALVSLMVKRSQSDWGDVLHRYRVFERLVRLVPAAIVYFGIALVPGVSDSLRSLTERVSSAFMVVIAVLAVGAFLSAGNAIYERGEISKTRPIKGYLQVVKIVLFVLGGVVILATLMNRSPLIFLSGIGAMTAVLLLVFKDTLLSLVASVQLTNNDMVRVGDWVEMPKYNADGDVIDMALHTIKIQNWDKTITTVPTSKFIEDSFKNWRGMSESGARRIKRSIAIDQNTIRFLTDAEIERLKGFVLLRDYIQRKEDELAAYNLSIGQAVGAVNRRRLTNVGTFRAYVVQYLRHHPKIHQDRTLLVRQLAPGPHGLPIEIYAFTNDPAWVAYEDIQSDILDHIIAILSEFSLQVFQHPTGKDFRQGLDRS
ncbi:MAG: mechanosensitive ion channel [Gemmatimonadetes bacterium]|nr:mechanosensitive ion channel [Gemmatimonadota bacterium]